MKVYKVGGAVRDKLLNRTVVDCDWVVVGATLDDLLAQGYQQVGKDFPVFLHPRSHEEYALARTERKVAPGYTGFTVNAAPTVTLEEDLLRRDLTINAMAEGADGRIIDPFNGQADLKAGVLRHVSAAFVEDPVRILRLARFAARFGFDVADETLSLMQEMVRRGETQALVPERVWAESQKALAETRPQRFFQVLRECGALASLFPELERLFGVPQPPRYHPEIDTGVHVMMVLEVAARLSQDVPVRFAALVHDLGKGTTPPDQWPSHRDHEERGAELIRTFCARYPVPNELRDLAVLVARYHTHCHRVAELRPGTLLKTLKGLDAFRRPARLERFLLACEADARGRKGLQDNAYPQADRVRAAFKAANAIQAQPLLDRGLKGKAIAEQLDSLRVHAIAGLSTGQRQIEPE